MKHGGQVIQKPIGEMAKLMKGLIPANIPEDYRFSHKSGENVLKGVIAFRDFLYIFCDKLISDGQVYSKPQKNPKNATDYPFLHTVKDLLVDIGCHGILTEGGDSLLITTLPTFTASVDDNGNIKKPKNTASSLMECLRFLTLCGFVFSGIDIEAKRLTISEKLLFEASYPNNPIMLTGLKAMSLADAQPQEDRWRNGWRNNDVFLRCDYRKMIAEEADTTGYLKDFLQPLPEKVQQFALQLNQRYIDKGMKCLTFISLFEYHFVYTYSKKNQRALTSNAIYQRRIWEFALTPRHGYCLVVRAKKTDKYLDVIDKFPLSLRQIITKGYGCDRKLRNECCQGGCEGIRIPLDESIIGMQSDIEKWFDNEVFIH